MFCSWSSLKCHITYQWEFGNTKNSTFIEKQEKIRILQVIIRIQYHLTNNKETQFVIAIKNAVYDPRRFVSNLFFTRDTLRRFLTWQARLPAQSMRSVINNSLMSEDGNHFLFVSCINIPLLSNSINITIALSTFTCTSLCINTEGILGTWIKMTLR